MLSLFHNPIGKVQVRTAGILTIGLTVTIGIALAFEHFGGFMPCKLCLEQRTPYYFAIPILALAWIAALLKWRPPLTRALLLIGALFMVYGLALAIFHTGVELKYWPGPADCTAATMKITHHAHDLLGDLNATRPPACDSAPGYFLGLSFAGWNVIASALFASIGICGALSKAGR
ncbi:disulfide bond formation protein B [Falsochrobactrum ovis]|uniref:Disulfide bond formation protein DsbB n=1 Tax=Falsochrobactrum ovis TaxID=1293442 RepID=A0A364JVM6_9HYPH|nr:disulfide bond formation protein B [Falsochrobactrum ovis]RAK29947.1 disulfide bond formation protein DsbB [Falsochrobactrum ovis]